MAEAIVDLTDEAAFDGEIVGENLDIMECPICLQICVHPSKLPCGHIFCFLCVKGLKNSRCALCRNEFPTEFLHKPELVVPKAFPVSSSTVEDSEYHWFYRGRNGWWQYDLRTCQEIEDAYKTGEKHCTILVAGYVYIVDFGQMLQQRQNDPSRKRQVKRDLSSVPKKGVAGLRFTDNSAPLPIEDSDINPSASSNNIMATVAATDAALRIASDTIESTLAPADEHSQPTNQFIAGSQSGPDQLAINSNDSHEGPR